jgi:fibronectin type 3 domain-containing protein
LTDVVWTGSQLAVVAFDGTVLTSPNGASWTPRAETGKSLRRILWTGARYVAAGEGNTVLASADTIEWQQETVDGDPPNGGITGLAWGGTTAIAVGRPSGVFRSHCGAWADFAFTPTAPQIGQETSFWTTKAQGLGRVRWEFGEAACDGTGPVREHACLGSPCTFPTKFTFASPGEKTVRLWGWSGEYDEGGNRIFVLMRSRKLTVAPTGTCATCLAPGSPSTPSPQHQAVRTGGTVVLSWAAPASGTPPFTYDVELDGGTVCLGASTAQCQVTGVAESAVLHTWRVIARNACGEKASPDWEFLACGAPGRPVADFDWMPAGPLPTWPLQQQPFPGQEVVFADRSSRAPGELAWSGLSAVGLISEPAPRATWWAAGTHNVGLRAANCLGWSEEAIKAVTVSPDVRPRRWAFDFGTDTSPVAAGFVGVRQSTAYTAVRGHGWAAGAVTGRERAAGDDLSRDFHFAVNATFVVDVPARTYDVTVWLGDTGRAHDEMALYLEGQLWDVVSSGVGEVARRVFRVTVTDGQLTIQLRDLGGADPNAVINGLEVVAADAVRVDFGTAASPVEAGFMAAGDGNRWAAPLWCGWSTGRVASRDRASGSDLLRDFHVTQDATFACAVGRGVWNVTLTLGDATARHDQMGIFLEGNLAGTVSTAARQFAVARHRLAIADGELTARLDDLGGSDIYVVVNAIEAVRVGPFDFGPPLSQVAPGYTAVTHGTRYSSTSGFGWLEGAVGSRDRGAGSALLRDFAMTVAATFAVDVPNGAYDVSMLMGDATNAHDEMAVILEGVQVAVVSTPRGQMHARTYRAAVSDGQLTVRLVDLGGADANVVINGLSIAPAP